LKENDVIVRHHHDGRVYVIEFPPGCRLRHSEAAGESVVYVSHDGDEVPVFEDPGELMVVLAEKGKYGLRLVGVEEVREP
jgi:hypothetical protein